MAASNSPAILSDEKTVTTAGTQVPLSTTRRVKALVIIAKKANTGQIYVGGSDVDSTVNDGLDAGETLAITVEDSGFDLADIFIDADTNGEGVDFYAIKVN